MIEVSYSEARARLAELLDRASEDREVVRIRRQGKQSSAVLLDADEYESLAETAHLLSSPANLRHLLRALAELEAGQGRSYDSVGDLWHDLAPASGEAPDSGQAAPRRSDPLVAAIARAFEKVLREQEAASQAPGGVATLPDVNVGRLGPDREG
jgi:antitoxin YefM